MSAQMPSPGEVFQSRYRMERLLGQGGFAQVFVATDLELRREVAIKVLRPQQDGYDDRNAARFMREARLVARLNHPNIVMMFDYGRTDDLLFAVFELIGGQDLSKLMKAPMQQDIAVAILIQVLDALASAHEAGLLHRDVKPDNIRVFRYMDDPHRVKLLDFGIARPTKDDAGLTASGMVVGTPRFMAPEVLYEEPLGPHSDIYSLGLVAYEMIVGERSNHLQHLIHKKPVVLPPTAKVSREVRRVINRMLEREVPPRYSSAAAARADLITAMRDARSAVDDVPRTLEVALEPVDPSPRPDPRPDPRAEPARPVGQTALFAGAGVALMLTLLAVAMLVGLSTEPEPSQAPTERPRPTISDPIKIEALPATPRIVVTPADAGHEMLPAHTAGCGQGFDFVGTRLLSHPDGLDVVEWVIHVPDDYRADEPHPMVVMLHDDSGTSAQNMLASTRLHETADRYDFIIAAPNDNDIAYPWTEAEDLDYVEHVVRLTGEMFCVDGERVFLLGHGGGGWGAEALSCEPWVAGVAFFSFLLEKPRFSCPDARQVPAMTVLPMDSNFLPPEGGADCVNNTKLGFDEFEAMWRDRNGCTGRPVKTSKPGGDCFSSDCRAPYVACRVDGGRRWTGAPVRAVDVLGCDGPANSFPLNEAIWEFFASIER